MTKKRELILLEEIRKLHKKVDFFKNKVLQKEITTYYFSDMTKTKLKKLVDLKKLYTDDDFNEWFKTKTPISDHHIDYLIKLILKHRKFIKYYKEETLKANIIIPILNLVDFLNVENEIAGFYEETIRYETENFILTGTTDFVVSKGLESAEKPYFFIQEFKRAKKSTDPEPQLLAELISAVELHDFKFIRGAFIEGEIWNFVILKKLAINKYQYVISKNFDSTKITDLKAIYKNLLFVKNEIIQRLKTESIID